MCLDLSLQRSIHQISYLTALPVRSYLSTYLQSWVPDFRNSIGPASRDARLSIGGHFRVCVLSIFSRLTFFLTFTSVTLHLVLLAFNPHPNSCMYVCSYVD